MNDYPWPDDLPEPTLLHEQATGRPGYQCPICKEVQLGRDVSIPLSPYEAAERGSWIMLVQYHLPKCRKESGAEDKATTQQ